MYRFSPKYLSKHINRHKSEISQYTMRLIDGQRWHFIFIFYLSLQVSQQQAYLIYSGLFTHCVCVCVCVCVCMHTHKERNEEKWKHWDLNQSLRICLPMQELHETWLWSLGKEDLLEEEMATHSRVLAWTNPWTEEPGGLQFMKSQRVGHDWATEHTCTHYAFYLEISLKIESCGLIASAVSLLFPTFFYTYERNKNETWLLKDDILIKKSVFFLPRAILVDNLKIRKSEESVCWV